MEENKVHNETGIFRAARRTKDRFRVCGTAFTLRLKLFLLLAMLIISILFSVIVILVVTGTFTAGLRETEKDLTLELDRFSNDVLEQFGQVSAHTVQFSKDLSNEIEKELAAQGFTPSELQNHPEALEPLIEEEYDRSLFALQKANGSGVFFILNATVNPSLDKAENSRAGLYIKNMEPNILNSASDYILILRGFSEVGRQNGVTLHSQWRMEFDIADAPYFHAPVQAAENTDLPLSRLYYWSNAATLPGTTEQIMLCSAPLIDSEGNVFGVCGFEVSSMLFKLSHMPGDTISQRTVCILAPMSDQELYISDAMIAGGFSVRSFREQNQILKIREDEPFNSYREQDGALYSGFHQPIRLYPEGSAFDEDKWAAALIIPDSDISASAVSLNLKLLGLFCCLLVIGIAISYILSRKFLMPLTRGVEIIKSNDFISRTNVPEIDDLIEFLSLAQANRELNNPKTRKADTLPESVFDEFVRNTKRLSPAERSVFNLYVEGYTAKEITNILCLSINTIKTHNKRIYMKMNVASREELLVYVNMLKEAGKEI